jgi:hypothetical protein
MAVEPIGFTRRRGSILARRLPKMFHLLPANGVAGPLRRRFYYASDSMPRPNRPRD